ncbi:hypothetical protein ACVIKO_001352 [Rhizobium ruizarguesonis]
MMLGENSPSFQTSVAAGKQALRLARPDVEEDRRDAGVGDHWLGERHVD